MAFDQLGDSKSVLGISKHKLATSEKQSSDCGVTYLPLGNPKDNLLLLPEANGVSRGVQPRWLIGAFLALASAVREENALMSYGFLFPKACGGVGGNVGCCRSPFSFRQQHWFSLVGRQDGSPSDQPADGYTHLCCFPGGLVEG